MAAETSSQAPTPETKKPGYLGRLKEKLGGIDKKQLLKDLLLSGTTGAMASSAAKALKIGILASGGGNFLAGAAGGAISSGVKEFVNITKEAYGKIAENEHVDTKAEKNKRAKLKRAWRATKESKGEILSKRMGKAVLKGAAFGLLGAGVVELGPDAFKYIDDNLHIKAWGAKTLASIKESAPAAISSWIPGSPTSVEVSSNPMPLPKPADPPSSKEALPNLAPSIKTTEQLKHLYETPGEKNIPDSNLKLVVHNVIFDDYGHEVGRGSGDRLIQLADQTTGRPVDTPPLWLTKDGKLITSLSDSSSPTSIPTEMQTALKSQGIDTASIKIKETTSHNPFNIIMKEIGHGKTHAFTFGDTIINPYDTDPGALNSKMSLTVMNTGLSEGIKLDGQLTYDEAGTVKAFNIDPTLENIPTDKFNIAIEKLKNQGWIITDGEGGNKLVTPPKTYEIELPNSSLPAPESITPQAPTPTIESDTPHTPIAEINTPASINPTGTAETSHPEEPNHPNKLSHTPPTETIVAALLAAGAMRYRRPISPTIKNITNTVTNRLKRAPSTLPNQDASVPETITTQPPQAIELGSDPEEEPARAGSELLSRADITDVHIYNSLQGLRPPDENYARFLKEIGLVLDRINFNYVDDDGLPLALSLNGLDDDQKLFLTTGINSYFRNKTLSANNDEEIDLWSKLDAIIDSDEIIVKKRPATPPPPPPRRRIP